MPRLIALITFVIDALCVIDILRSDKDTERKMLWIIAVIFLPVLGLCCILWWGGSKKNRIYLLNLCFGLCPHHSR